MTKETQHQTELDRGDITYYGDVPKQIKLDRLYTVPIEVGITFGEQINDDGSIVEVRFHDEGHIEAELLDDPGPLDDNYEIIWERK